MIALSSSAVAGVLLISSQVLTVFPENQSRNGIYRQRSSLFVRSFCTLVCCKLSYTLEVDAFCGKNKQEKDKNLSKVAKPLKDFYITLKEFNYFWTFYPERLWSLPSLFIEIPCETGMKTFSVCCKNVKISSERMFWALRNVSAANENIRMFFFLLENLNGKKAREEFVESIHSTSH